LKTEELENYSTGGGVIAVMDTGKKEGEQKTVPQGRKD